MLNALPVHLSDRFMAMPVCIVKYRVKRPRAQNKVIVFYTFFETSRAKRSLWETIFLTFAGVAQNLVENEPSYTFDV